MKTHCGWRCVAFWLIFTGLAGHAGGQDQPEGVHPGTGGRVLPAPPAPIPSFRLAILPDRTTGRDWGIPYLIRAIEDLNRVRPDAVISIGDMVQGYTRSEVTWEAEVAEFNQIIDDLTMPFYPLAGNHEVVSGTRDRSDLTFHQKYQEFFGPLYYRVDFAFLHVIVLFTDDPTFEERWRHGLGETQLAWLTEQLHALHDTDKPVFVMMHRPLWRTSRAQWDDVIHPMLVDAGVDAVIAGHFHALQRDPDRDGIEYHLVGTCGGSIDQYPLAGQLQHLTYLESDASGNIRIYHQPVGTTLPDDFILRVDQDRSFKLKTYDEVVTFLDAPREPLHAAVDTEVRVQLHNPTDVPIVFVPGIYDSEPRPRTWPGSMWLSRIAQDRFNPFVTDINTPFMLSDEPEPVELEPGETREVALQVMSPAVDSPRNPPEFHFEATFIDSRDREVPVIVRRRMPLRRTITFDENGRTRRWPIAAWEFSVYDTLEPNPSVMIEHRRDAGAVDFHITVPDDVQSGYQPVDADAIDRFVDPASDAVLLRIAQEGRVRTWLVEPFLRSTVFRVDGKIDRSAETAPPVTPDPAIQADFEMFDTGWRGVLRIPVGRLTGFDLSKPLSINLGVSDNDDTYHTQWRWLAPDAWPASIVLGR